MTDLTYEDISNLLGLTFPITQEQFLFLPRQPRVGPVMVLPGHHENSYLQLYLNATIGEVEGLRVITGEPNYSLTDINPLTIYLGYNSDLTQLHVGNIASDPWRKIAIPTPEFVAYMTKPIQEC